MWLGCLILGSKGNSLCEQNYLHLGLKESQTEKAYPSKVKEESNRGQYFHRIERECGNKERKYKEITM